VYFKLLSAANHSERRRISGRCVRIWTPVESVTVTRTRNVQILADVMASLLLTWLFNDAASIENVQLRIIRRLAIWTNSWNDNLQGKLIYSELICASAAFRATWTDPEIEVRSREPPPEVLCSFEHVLGRTLGGNVTSVLLLLRINTGCKRGNSRYGSVKCECVTWLSRDQYVRFGGFTPVTTKNTNCWALRRVAWQTLLDDVWEERSATIFKAEE
jgi:hypothetical protein